jgi:hypothetical protein
MLFAHLARDVDLVLQKGGRLGRRYGEVADLTRTILGTVANEEGPKQAAANTPDHRSGWYR